MNMREVIEENQILAILRDVPLEQTLDYVQAVVDGGITFFEVALNSKYSYQQIKLLREHFGDSIYLGAGTATTVERGQEAISAGAQFLLSPSADEPVLKFCQENKIPLLPGVLTPSDVSLCLRYGFCMLKLFPAGTMPLNYVKSLKGPLDNTDYMAIGGVSAENAVSFLKAGYLGIGMSSNLMPSDVLEEGNWKKGRQHILALVKKIKESL